MQAQNLKDVIGLPTENIIGIQPVGRLLNMGLEEAAECAELVGEKHNIPCHNIAINTGDRFDHELTERFDALGRLIVAAGEEIRVE